ncbi:MAG: DUF305 domain-containing protein [Micromonospora sp.]
MTRVRFLAELADTRAADPEVKKLAGQIKAAQDPEIATMTGWLSAWGMPAPSASTGHGTSMPGMDHGMPGMMSDADMAKLAAASGADFDKAVPDHDDRAPRGRDHHGEG